MTGKYIEIDISEFEQFTEKLRSLADGKLKERLAEILDATRFEMLKIIEDTIIELQVVDTRELLKSFHVEEFDESGLVMTIGSNVEYAGWVNDGHATIGPGGGFIAKDGILSRFVPGVWHGKKFEYIPGAKTGMLLHQQWVEGKHYMERALTVMEKRFPKAVERGLDQWLNNYFS